MKYTIIALGGSLIVRDKPNTAFLKKFRGFILKFLRRGHRFVIVAGGGKITRHYQQAAAKVIKIPDEDLDWLGIHATRLNAQLLRTIFWKEACPVIIDNLKKPVRGRPKLLIASGTHPGWSTDYIGVTLARRFSANRVIVAGTYDGVYNKDFEKYKNARRVPNMSWKTYRGLIARSWNPGYRAPVDPVAARAAERFHIRVDVLAGKNFSNFARCIAQKTFYGSTIA